MEQTIEDDMEEISETSVSIGGWLGTMMLMLVPGINIIAILAMAFGSKNENKKAFARAVVLVTLLCITVALVGMALTCNKFDYGALFEEMFSFVKALINKIKA